MADEVFEKISFELEQDADGYPPDRWESLWAVALGRDDLYRLDNIPLYVKGVSSEDIVRAEPNDGRLEFVRLVEPSRNSVYRVFVCDQSDVQAARDSSGRWVASRSNPMFLGSSRWKYREVSR